MIGAGRTAMAILEVAAPTADDVALIAAVAGSSGFPHLGTLRAEHTS